MIGINTGKLVIGSAYFGQKRVLSNEELKIQSVLLAEMHSNAFKHPYIETFNANAYQHIGETKRTQQKPFKRLRAFCAKIVGVFG